MIYKYKLIRSNRKTLAIQIDRDCNIIVRSPLKMPLKDVEAFLEDKKKWIEKSVLAQRKRASERKEYTEEEINLLRKKAKEIIPQKVSYYSEIMGVKPIGVKINSAKTRYGSCSGKNSLNFSLFLMDKNEDFINYVVVHELAHIKYHNHSKEFYSFVKDFVPNYKELEKLYK